MKNSNPNTPGPIPKGYSQVIRGEIQSGDYLWVPETRDFEIAEKEDIHAPVEAFKMVIRRK